jgi:hypothetical protein
MKLKLIFQYFISIKLIELKQFTVLAKIQFFD